MYTQIFFKEINAQKQIDKFAKRYGDKKIVLYGAGAFAKKMFEEYDLSALNIIGISDKKFETVKPETCFGFRVFTPDELHSLEFDVIFITLLLPHQVLKPLRKFKKHKIFYLKENFFKRYFSKLLPKISDEKCMICGFKKLHRHEASIAPFLTDRMFNFEKKETELLFCPRCKITYFKLRPNEEQAARYYKDYGSEAFRRHRAKYEPLLYESSVSLTDICADKDFRKTEIENNISLIRKNVKDFKKVLDFGGYGSHFPLSFGNVEKYAFDISIEENPENPYFVSDMNKLEKENFDFIMSTHVLEHLSSPKEQVEKMASLINKDGYIYIELPDETGLCNDVNKSFFQKMRNSPQYVMHEHINFYKPETVKFMLENSGFEVLVSRYKKCDYFQGFKGYIWCLARKIKE